MLEVPAEREEELASALARGTLGARIGEAGGGRRRVEVFLASPADADRALSAATHLLRRAGLDPHDCGLRKTEVADEGWVEAYRAGLEPFRLGRRFLVQPGDREVAAEGMEPILLAPGRAFGTGEHPTTQLCAAHLERLVEPGSRWLDLGCGTGILAVVARRCGAGEVLALDDDADAVRVARAVFRDNRAGPRVIAREGSVGDAGSGGWDGVVCNISAAFLTQAASRLHVLLRPRGLLIAAGFLSDELVPVRTALEAAGLREESLEEADVWSALVMRRS